MKALVVDDSRAMRSIISRFLGELKVEVIEAASGSEALFKLGKMEPPDVVLLDWNMPEPNGYECLQAIREMSAYDGVRIMMVTTESEMSQVAIALEAGADEYLMKPFDRQTLLEKLPRVLNPWRIFIWIILFTCNRTQN